MTRLAGPPRVKPIVRRRFAVGAKVRVLNPGISGVVIEAEDEPKQMAEYWHKVECRKQDGAAYTRREPGCNLQLVPEPMGKPRQPEPPRSITVHQYGDGARNYIDSPDHSRNYSGADAGELFQKVREFIESVSAEAEQRQLLLDRLNALEAARDTPSWPERYTQLMAVASDHITVLTFALPYFVQLAALYQGS